MTEEMKLTFWEFLKYHPKDYEITEGHPSGIQGGKSRACVKMDPYFPDLREYTEFREPFIGGGSVAIHVTKKYPHLKVWVNDLYEPLVNFWQQLQMFGPEMKDRLQELKSEHPDPDSAKRLFLESKEYLNDESNLDSLRRAVESFYVVNKCSFSGLTESSSFSKQASDFQLLNARNRKTSRIFRNNCKLAYHQLFLRLSFI